MGAQICGRSEQDTAEAQDPARPRGELRTEFAPGINARRAKCAPRRRIHAHLSVDAAHPAGSWRPPPRGRRAAAAATAATTAPMTGARRTTHRAPRRLPRARRWRLPVGDVRRSRRRRQRRLQNQLPSLPREAVSKLLAAAAAPPSPDMSSLEPAPSAAPARADTPPPEEPRSASPQSPFVAYLERLDTIRLAHGVEPVPVADTVETPLEQQLRENAARRLAASAADVVRQRPDAWSLAAFAEPAQIDEFGLRHPGPPPDAPPPQLPSLASADDGSEYSYEYYTTHMPRRAPSRRSTRPTTSPTTRRGGRGSARASARSSGRRRRARRRSSGRGRRPSASAGSG